MKGLLGRMAKNARKHGKPIAVTPPGVPMTPPGYEGSGSLLYDLQEMYGRAALNDPHVRAAIRRQYKGQIDFKQVDGEWQLVLVAKQPKN